MSAPVRRPLLAAVAVAGLAFVGPNSPSSRATSPPPAAPPRPAAQPSSGERWIEAARAALDDARKVRVPFAEPEPLALEPAEAVAFAFEAFGGQTLELKLAREPAAAEAEVFVEVFRVVDVLGAALRHRVGALRPGASTLTTRLPRDGTYEVLVQTGPRGAGRYGLTLELGAALPFPVVGADAEAIRSPFGAPRDAGSRRHEGVDIYVKPLTPVLAVAAGRAMPRQDDFGGNTVWLNTPGTSYYYAHLDRVAVREGQRVKKGDVLGYVGNTGNARSTPSHLHFGVYRRGREPIDPLPLLVGQRFGLPPPAAPAAGAGG